MSLSMTDLDYIKRILKNLGIDLSSYKDPFLRRRITMRMKALGVKSIYEYGRILREDPSEIQRLLDNVTINVSYFFRDPHVWVAVRDKVFIPLIRHKLTNGIRSLRIWSAGCARGEEPYSISILLHELLGPVVHRFQISIIATDIDPTAISYAKNGCYSSQVLSNVPRSWLRKYFSYDPFSGCYRVTPQVKELVTFLRHDLTKDLPLHNIDVIFCRYVMIYFTKDTQIKVLRAFREALNDGGYLVLGSAEFLPEELHEYFETVDLRARIYRKIR